MKCIGLFFAFLALARGSEAADPTLGRLYTLQEASHFEEGCFYLCECPVVHRDDLQGRFTLLPSGTKDGYEVYSVVDLEWVVGAETVAPLPIEVRGSGTYRISRSAELQELVLDLVVGDRKIEHYDSGVVSVRVPFPAIDIDLLTYPYGCYDTVFTLSAVPATLFLRPPKLRFEQHDPGRGALTTWGRLKRLWAP